jgi:two-component sensor histidine kinase
VTWGGVQPPSEVRRARWWQSGVRGRLLTLVAAATIPVAVIAGHTVWTSYGVDLQRGQRDALVLREVAAARHGAAVDAMKELLAGLAANGDLLGLAPEACDAELGRLRALMPQRYSNFWVLDADGALLCSGLPGERGQSYAHRDYVPILRATRAFTLGEFTRGAVTQRAILPGVAPILASDGTLRAMVGGGLFLDVFLRSERAVPVVGDHHVWLLDEDGSTLPLGSAAGSVLPQPDSLAELLRHRGATIQGPARDGTPHSWSVELLEPGLHLLVGLSDEQTLQTARRTFRQRLIELTLFLLACLAAILVGVERGVSQPLRRLAERVRVWTPGHPYVPRARDDEPVEVRDLDRALSAAASALQGREQSLSAALQQRDLLMAEMHHRVKNNLQIVASLLSLQADRVRDEAARREFALARDRVRALATLHRHLHTTQTVQRVALRPFLDELSGQLSEALGGRDSAVVIRIDADDVELGADQSISVALLLTEAVSNAMLHAFPDGRPGTITICLRVVDNEVLLRVIDDGIGLGARTPAGDGLGHQLIQGFASHLGGAADITSDEGTCVSVRFPLSAPVETLRGAA